MPGSQRHLTTHLADFWLARGAVLVIVGLQIGIVNDLTVGPRWFAPCLELALLIPLSIGTAWVQKRARKASTDKQWHSVGAHVTEKGALTGSPAGIKQISTES